MIAKVLWIEGKRAESSSFVPTLRDKGYTVEVVATIVAANSLITEFKPHIAIINAASRQIAWKKICRQLKEKNENLPVILINTADPQHKEEEVFWDNFSYPLTTSELDKKLVPRISNTGIILWIYKNQCKPHIKYLLDTGYTVIIVDSGAECLNWLEENKPDAVVINAASQRSSGSRILNSIKNLQYELPIFVITKPKLSIKSDLASERPNEELILPFTFRKLVNRINNYLPVEGKKILKVGPIQLDIERKRLKCQKRKAKLTPRLMQLMTIFMQHPGEVLEREALFRQVWSTQYAEDTRTLDVHISWLRKALEENPRQPKYLKTVRGVGYRLDTENLG